MRVLGKVACTAPFVLIGGVQYRWCAKWYPDTFIAHSQILQGRVAAVLVLAKHWTDEMVSGS